MKKFVFAFISLILMSFSALSFADKVIISGSPVVLQQQNGVYTLPSDYTTTGSYYYVTVDGTNRVCYLEQQPNLASLNPQTMNVEVSGKQVQWTCYNYDDQYFTVAQ